MLHARLVQPAHLRLSSGTILPASPLKNRGLVQPASLKRHWVLIHVTVAQPANTQPQQRQAIAETAQQAIFLHEVGAAPTLARTYAPLVPRANIPLCQAPLLVPNVQQASTRQVAWASARLALQVAQHPRAAGFAPIARLALIQPWQACTSALFVGQGYISKGRRTRCA